MDKNKKKDIDEWAGAGINGAPSFQGVAYGYGGRAQLAGPPRPLPDDFEKVIDDLVADELQDLFGSRQAIFTERNQSDANYRDLPGFPATNTLVAKQSFVPNDPAERDNVDWLGPTVGGLAIKDIPGNTSNNWKATTPEKRGKQIVDINALVRDYALPEEAMPEGMVSSTGRSVGGSWSPNQLVAQKDWQAETEERATGDMDAKNPVGSMGVILKPVRFVPDSAENQVRMEQKTTKRTVINSEDFSMSTSNLIEAIQKIIKEELEEAEELGTQETFQNAIQAMMSLIQQHGGKELTDWERVVPPEERAKLNRFASAATKISQHVQGSKTLGDVGQQKKGVGDIRAGIQQRQQQKQVPPLAVRNAKLSALRRPPQQQGQQPPQVGESLRALVENLLEEALSHRGSFTDGKNK